MRFATSDIFEAALLRMHGAELLDLRSDVSYRKPRVTFILESEDDSMTYIQQDYSDGTANVNLLTYRKYLEALKSYMFQYLKKSGEATS